MKFHYYLMLALVGCTSWLHAATEPSPVYQAYIQQWGPTAMEQQKEYGIPASITIAQGLLESGAGQSELAQQANNHFGIKCGKNWMGATYYHDDDTVGECFRVYLDATESYKDHSLFLKRPRYSTLFEIAIEDYAGWAQRIRECGYATDPQYAQKLIRIIEDYHLDSLTLVAIDEVPQDSLIEHPISRKTSQPAKVIAAEVPVMEDAPKTAREEKKLFFLNYRRLKANNVKYIQAKQGDTYANIAFRLNIRERDLRIWNDALGLELLPGERVFIQAKRKYADKQKTLMWVHPGESLRMIAQREGIQLKTIYQLNGLPSDVRVFSTRQQILLRKQKKN